MIRPHSYGIAWLLVAAASAGNITTALGPDFFIDAAATGGGDNDNDSTLISLYRKVTYRGLPVSEILANITLGGSSSSLGQATLVVQSGTLTATKDPTAGRDAFSNEVFVEANGGNLNVAGNADFGRITEGADGSLIIVGGAVQIGGKLTLGRCALDLTFDHGYPHIPGTVTTLVSYATRDGRCEREHGLQTDRQHRLHFLVC